MSMERLREIRLYRKLEHDLNYRERIAQKLKQVSTTNNSINSSQLSQNYHKLNHNKKHKIQEQKNAQIQRQNKILFNKIKAQSSNIDNISKLNRKNKNRTSRTSKYIQDKNSNRNHKQIYYHKNNQNNKYNLSQNKKNQENWQSRVSFNQNQALLRARPKKDKVKTQAILEYLAHYQNNLNENEIGNTQFAHSLVQENPQSRTGLKNIGKQMVLFQGQAEIDQVRFKTKILIRNKIYYLIGKNKHTQILLKMSLQQYNRFQKNILKGNPSQIFQYLLLDKGQIRFRTSEQSNKMCEIKQQSQEEGSAMHFKHMKMNKAKQFGKLNDIHIKSDIIDVKQQMLRRIKQLKVYSRDGRLEGDRFKKIPENYYNNRLVKAGHEASENRIRQKQLQNLLANSNPRLIRMKKQPKCSNFNNNSMAQKLYESPIFFYDCQNSEQLDRRNTTIENKYRLPNVGGKI